MAPDHSRLGLENKFLENKSGRIFCFRPVYFKKSWQEIWVRVNQPSEVKQYHEALFLPDRPQTKMQYFTIVQDKLHSFNIQSHRSKRGLLATPVQKISKITYTATGSHF